MAPRDAKMVSERNSPNGVPRATITGAIKRQILPNKTPVKEVISVWVGDTMFDVLTVRMPKDVDTDDFKMRQKYRRVP